MNYDDKSLFFNKIWHGVLIGFILPVLIFLIYYIFRFGHYQFADYLSFLVKSEKLANVLSISVLPNLVPFMLLINSHRYSAGRGVLGATVLLGIMVFVLKFV